MSGLAGRGASAAGDVLAREGFASSRNRCLSSAIALAHCGSLARFVVSPGSAAMSYKGSPWRPSSFPGAETMSATRADRSNRLCFCQRP
jgi:hypothetical protein